MHLSPDAAETIALNALNWLVSNEELLGVFMGSTGAGADDLLTGAANPEFLGSVLDFLLLDDAWVIEFCNSCDIEYSQLIPARAALPGGDQIHWT
ncbi:MAG: DUF3572 domain-containing protein [Arenibacterium sp.]